MPSNKTSTKPSTAKPATTAKPAPLSYKRRAIVRAAIEAYYPGSSLPFNSANATKPESLYVSRIAEPKHRIGDNGPSVRDDGFLACSYAAFGTEPHNPADLHSDLGAVSRQASVANYAVDKSGRPYITASGAERGAAILKKAFDLQALKRELGAVK